MGFRDLRDFNLAMLAKQGWRLIQGYDSLPYRCFKARYFPRTSFLEAKELLGCSYVWRSILAVLPILRLGSCWRVGNGSSISGFLTIPLIKFCTQDMSWLEIDPRE